MKTVFATAAVLVVAVLALAPFVEAEEEEDAAQAYLDRLAALRKAGDDDEIQGALAEAAATYKTANAAVQAKLLGEIGKIAKEKKLGTARVAAVDALVELGDPKAAWKEIAKLLPPGKAEESSELDFSVVKAAGAMAQSKASKSLLDLVAKAKDAKLAKAAAEALGGFSVDKKGRAKLLEEMISLGKRLRPGQASGKPASGAASERWGVVGPGLVGGLNRLTGREERSFEAWEEVWQVNKKKPQELFPAGD